jgi:hypothetical protein
MVVVRMFGQFGQCGERQGLKDLFVVKRCQAVKCVTIIIAKRHFIASFQKGIFSQLTCEPHIWVVLACCSMHHITARRSLRPLPSTILNFPTTTISDIKSTTARGLAQHINEASACFHCAAVTLYCFRPRFTTALPNHEIS